LGFQMYSKCTTDQICHKNNKYDKANNSEISFEYYNKAS
jgi:hypothetical protein